jgi:hypothetical protein
MAKGAIEELLAGGGDVRCKVISKDISVHWWRTLDKPGARCLCGKTVKKAENETAGPAGTEPAQTKGGYL